MEQPLGMLRGRPAGGAMRFSKMHGAGNDFVILDLRDSGGLDPGLCHVIADRHTGVGCDLILGIEDPLDDGAAASYRIWTSDGSPSQQCGNGARCIAAWLLRDGTASGRSFFLDSPSGRIPIEVVSEMFFRIGMGCPNFEPSAIPLADTQISLDLYPLTLPGGDSLEVAAVSMGNPHAVIEVPDIRCAEVERIGVAVREARRFPESVNVGFAEIVSRDRIRLRVHEYGAGETRACGTGACAAAATFMRQGRLDRSVTVSLPGGDLQIHWPDDMSEMHLDGPAAFTFEGEFSHAPL